MKLKTTIKITQGPMRGHTVEIEKELGPEDTLVDFLSWCAQQEKEANDHYKALAALDEATVEPTAPSLGPWQTGITPGQMNELNKAILEWEKTRSAGRISYDTTARTSRDELFQPIGTLTGIT